MLRSDTDALEDFFAGRDESARLFEVVRDAVAQIGDAEVRVTRSQIAFCRRRGFAFVWMPQQYLGRGAPLVLTIALRRRDDSSRWKQVVEPYPGRFTHHLELRDGSEMDEEVRSWLREAWTQAG